MESRVFNAWSSGVAVKAAANHIKSINCSSRWLALLCGQTSPPSIQVGLASRSRCRTSTHSVKTSSKPKKRVHQLPSSQREGFLFIALEAKTEDKHPLVGQELAPRREWTDGPGARRAHPDVIVLDLKLEKMDGLTVLRQVHSLNRNQRVIIYSGAWDPKTEQQILAFGITEMVKKGCSLDHLEEALQHALESPNPGKEDTLPKGKG